MLPLVHNKYSNLLMVHWHPSMSWSTLKLNETLHYIAVDIGKTFYLRGYIYRSRIALNGRLALQSMIVEHQQPHSGIGAGAGMLLSRRTCGNKMRDQHYQGFLFPPTALWDCIFWVPWRYTMASLCQVIKAILFIVRGRKILT